MKPTKENERVVINKYANTLKKEFSEINKKLLDVHDSVLYKEYCQRIYSIAWESLRNKYVREYLPNMVVDIFIVSFHWATSFSEGISIDINSSAVVAFESWLRNYPDKLTFGNEFNDALFDLGKYTDTSRVIGAWSTVVDYVRLKDKRIDSIEYFHKSIENHMKIKEMEKYSEKMDAINIFIGAKAIRVISMIFVLRGKIEFERVFDSLKEHKEYMQKYISGDPMMISRLFAFRVLELYKGKEEIKKEESLYHYTSVDTLFDILENGRIKMSYSKNYSDDNEGKMFKDEPEPIYSLSMTKNGDSVALWGNYTNNVGVAIKVDTNVLLNSLSGIKSIVQNPVDRGYVSYRQIFNGDVIYGDESKNKLEKMFNETADYFNEICSISNISVLKKWFFGIHTHLAKVKPFEYEKEFRLLIPENNVKNKDIYGGYINDGLYLKIDPTHLISGVTVGPTLKLKKYELKNLKNLLKAHGMEKLISYSKATIKPK